MFKMLGKKEAFLLKAIFLLYLNTCAVTKRLLNHVRNYCWDIPLIALVN